MSPSPVLPFPSRLESPIPLRIERPRSRLRLHGLLLVATFLTLAVAGGWNEGAQTLVLMFARGLGYACWVLAILGAHELGHYAACRYHRIPATLPFFIPGIPPIGSFGAVIRIRGRIPDRNALFDVAAAGPIAGFLVTLPALVWGLATAQTLEPSRLDEGATFLGQPLLVSLLEPVLRDGTETLLVNPAFMAGWVGVLVTSLNLFPVGQLDGGHAAYAVSPRLHSVLAHATLFALAALIAFQAYAGQIPSYILWFAILLYMRDRHPRLVDEYAPLGRGRRLVALLLAIVFALCLIPAPFQF